MFSYCGAGAPGDDSSEEGCFPRPAKGLAAVAGFWRRRRIENLTHQIQYLISSSTSRWRMCREFANQVTLTQVDSGEMTIFRGVIVSVVVCTPASSTRLEFWATECQQSATFSFGSLPLVLTSAIGDPRLQDGAMPDYGD